MNFPILTIGILVHFFGGYFASFTKSRRAHRQICPLEFHLVCNRESNLALAKMNLKSKEEAALSIELFNDMASPLVTPRKSRHSKRSRRATPASKSAPDLSCTCAMTASESAAEQPSCTHLITMKDEKNFEAISALLLVDQESEQRAQYWAPSPAAPINVIEAKFRSDLAATFNTEERNIIILRVRCSAEDEDVDGIIAELTTSNDKVVGLPKPQYLGAFSRNRSPPELLTVQFVILKRHSGSRRASTTPFLVETELVDARLAANRIRVAYAQKALAGLRLLDVQAVYELFEVEACTTNFALIIQAAVAATFIVATSLCGCYIACKKNRDYDNDLQKS